MSEKIHTFCHICPNHCGLEAIIENGRVIDVRASAEAGPVSMCSVQKGPLHLLGTINAPDRLRKPLKRVGEKGEGKWEEISWDEALDIIAEKLIEVKEKYGPEYVALILGEPKGLEFHVAQRFASAFGTPNVITPGNYCGVQTTESRRFTFGSPYIVARMDLKPKVVIIWGSNLAHTGGTFANINRYELYKLLTRGETKLVIIDPRNIEIWPEKGMRASDADYWIRPRPNSDGALAMGMIKVIIEEELYDKKFVSEWCVGFEELRNEVSTFSLEEVEELTWVAKETIQEVARLYATNKPAVIGTANALEGSPVAFQTLRAIAILMGITGNVNTPWGGHSEVIPPNFYRPGRFMFTDVKEVLEKYPRSPERSIAPDVPFASRFGYIPTQALVRALITGKPYRPKVGLAFVTNPLLTYPDSRVAELAFKKFELLVVAELFHTSTTRVADIVLPAAFIHEHDTIAFWPSWFANIRAHRKVVDPPGEAWPDIKIIIELAKRVGLEKYFPWKNEEELMNYWLKPLGLTWKKFRDEVRFIHGKIKYDPEKVVGYNTPSGKIEIYCKKLEEYGISPIPRFEEFRKALKGRFEPDEGYPLIMTCYKSEIFMLSGYRNVKILREKSLPPTALMNPETARELGLKEGDWVWIETCKGRVKQRLSLQPGMHPKVIAVEFGWGDYGYKDSNVNLITDYNGPWDPTGSVALRGYPCKVYKAEEDGG